MEQARQATARSCRTLAGCQPGRATRGCARRLSSRRISTENATNSMRSVQAAQDSVSAQETLSVHSSARAAELDGVRGLAIVSVLLWHLMVMPHVLAPDGPKPAGMMWLVRLFSLSWAAAICSSASAVS